jgi:hypothetical protein
MESRAGTRAVNKFVGAQISFYFPWHFECSTIPPLVEHKRDCANERKEEIFKCTAHIMCGKLETDDGQLKAEFLITCLQIIVVLLRLFQFQSNSNLDLIT